MLRPPLRSPWARLAVLTLLCTGLAVGQAGASQADGDAAPAHKAVSARTTSSVALSHKPKAGHCYNVAGKAARNKPTLKAHPVGCTKKHTLWILKVKTVPKRIGMHNITGSNKALWKFEEKVCLAAVQRSVGKLDGRYGLTAYGRYNFLPSKKARAHGAHWLTCALGIYKGPTKLLVTKKKRPERLSWHPSNQIRMCATTKSARISCARPHAFRVRYVTTFKAATRKAQAKAGAFCRGRAHTSTWVYAWTLIGHPGGKKHRYAGSCLPLNHR